MLVSWGSALDHKSLVEGIEATRVEDRTSVAFHTLGFELLSGALLDAINWGPVELEDDRETALWKALVSAAEKGPLTPEVVIAALNREVRELLQQPRRRFLIATTLSISNVWEDEEFEFEGVTFRLTRKLPPRILKARKDSPVEQYVRVPEPETFAGLTVAVTARSDAEAADIALERLGLVRAIWNLSLNRRTLSRDSSGTDRPINPVVTGPLHTLHERTGKRATNRFWYEPEFVGKKHLLDWREARARLTTFQRRVCRKLLDKRLGRHLRIGLSRYVNALDSPTFELSIVRLWTTLEHLTGTAFGDHKVTARRTVALYTDTQIATQLVNHLRLSRNRIVHGMEELKRGERSAWAVKGHVERLLTMVIDNPQGFRTPDDIFWFLDLPADTVELRRRQILLRKGLAFRTPKEG